jgi:hypothetical protein
MRLRLAILVAGCSGFVALSYEIVWYRLLAVMTRGIASTFGLLLAAYLLGLAIGSRAVAVYCREKGGDVRQLRALAAFVVIANVIGPTSDPMTRGRRTLPTSGSGSPSSRYRRRSSARSCRSSATSASTPMTARACGSRMSTSRTSSARRSEACSRASS